MIKKLDQIASGKLVIISLFLLIVGTSALFTLGPYTTVQQLNENDPLPEEQLSTPEYTLAVMERIGGEGRELYASFQLMDVLNPILICSFLIFLLVWLSQHVHMASKLRLVVYLPLMIAIAELWENTLLYSTAISFPVVPTGLDTLQVATAIKFGGLILSLLVALILMCVALIQKIKRGKSGDGI